VAFREGWKMIGGPGAITFPDREGPEVTGTVVEELPWPYGAS